MTLSPEMPVSDLLTGRPQVSSLFIQWGLACVGCPLNHLCTLDEMRSIYNLDWADFGEQINQRMTNT